MVKQIKSQAIVRENANRLRPYTYTKMYLQLHYHPPSKAQRHLQLLIPIMGLWPNHIPHPKLFISQYSSLNNNKDTTTYWLVKPQSKESSLIFVFSSPTPPQTAMFNYSKGPVSSVTSLGFYCYYLI